jgi:MarR family 2-MHQ and catechol resistance regulon transcriptional repressor
MSESKWSVSRSEGHRLVVTIVRTAERLQKEADRFLRDYGITVAQLNLLIILAADREGASPSRIGQQLVVSRANVTGMVSRLKRLGLCRVEPDPADGRIKRVRLTTRGRRLLDRIDDPYFREIDRLTGGLTASRLKSVSDTLDRLVAGL